MNLKSSTNKDFNREVTVLVILSVFLLVLLVLLPSCDVRMKGNANIEINNNYNNNVNTQLDEFIRVQNEKEANAVRANANYGNLSTNELERRIKEGVNKVR